MVAYPRLLAGLVVVSACCSGGCRDAGSRRSEEPPEHTVVHRRHHGSSDDDDLPVRPVRRVYAKNRFVWIRRSPDEESDWIGYISLGESLRVRDHGATPAKDDTGCPEWIGVEPEGWVCVGKNATLDPNDDVVMHLAEHAADRSSPWPYDYARSLGAARYRGLPTAQDEHAREGDVELLRKRIDQARLVDGVDAVRAIDPRLAGAELGMTGKTPPPLFQPPGGVLETDDDVALGSTVAYSYEFDYHGRAWLLSWDHGVIPEARVTKYPRSPFHGVALGHGFELPLAFTKKSPAPKFTRDAGGAFVESKDAYPAQSAIQLTREAPVADSSGKTFRATREAGTFVAERDVVLVTPLGEPPKLPPGGRRTWIEVSTVGGYLVAYERDEPVYATLISAGRARMLDDKTMAPISSTPNGTFEILSKLETTTMRPEPPKGRPAGGFAQDAPKGAGLGEPRGAFAAVGTTPASPGSVHAEVMYTQVFHEGFALHGAYWHDDWGDRKSAGCVNLSPIDSKWLFDWSEPSVPIDWHARRTMPGDPVTRVVVHP